MKQTFRSRLTPNQRIRIYYKDTPAGPWGWIEGDVIDNGDGSRVSQIRVSAEKKSYADDASNIGHAEMIFSEDLIFALEDNE